ncbi:MAG TPA: O-antigen ligase family protein [Candidatus Saccharimonadales bacterium]|nr:O-antigen ligase family protein [Candidatus Saccharimonadales bacterium]
MRTSALKYTVLSWVSVFTILILFLMPFHALLTVWGSSLFGHYTSLRLWKEVLLVIGAFGVLYLIAMDSKIRTHTLSRRLAWLILIYILLTAVWGLLALNQHDVTLKALGYGLIVNLRYLVFFLVTWAVALRMSRLRSYWQWAVYWPAMGVALFGLLQIFVLPHDFLRHLGYSDATIPVFETINNNREYIRIASTLRGANPLGAYLLIPISLLAVLLLNPKRRTWLQGGFLAALLTVLFFSFSRSAWIGAALSILVVLLVSVRSRPARRVTMAIIAGLVLIGAGLTLVYRHNPRFQNFIFHTQTRSEVKTTSNEHHLSALKTGLDEVWDYPLGQGPGTAGPASIYNAGHKPRIAENYFVQISQEVGWLGFATFVLICAGVGYLLWLRRADPLALSLFASLIGLTFINLLSHAWADDTLAYVWWGLAGVAMAPDRKAEAALKDGTADTDNPEDKDERPAKPAKKSAAKTRR